MRTRIKYELSKKEKHWFVIRKLCPDTLDAFIQKYIVFKDRKVQYADVLKIMSRYVDVKSNVYYMHMDGGNYMAFTDAMSACMEELFPSVVICNDNVAFFKSDTEGVAGMRCILVKNQ